jgi:hypothetical protein
MIELIFPVHRTRRNDNGFFRWAIVVDLKSSVVLFLGAPLKEESALKRVALYLVATQGSVSEWNVSTEAWPATSGWRLSLIAST